MIFVINLARSLTNLRIQGFKKQTINSNFLRKLSIKKIEELRAL